MPLFTKFPCELSLVPDADGGRVGCVLLPRKQNIRKSSENTGPDYRDSMARDVLRRSSVGACVVRFASAGPEREGVGGDRSGCGEWGRVL